MKNSGVEWIGKIPDDWEVSKVKHNATVFAGYPFDSNKFSTQNGFPLIRIRDITSGNIETFFDGEFDSSFIITKDDLIIGMDGDFNLRWWNNQDALLNQRCCKITTKKKLNKRYLYYCIPFDMQNINNLAYSTTVKHLSNSDILNISIPFPPKETQQKIAEYLDSKCSKIEDTIQNQQQVIEKLKAYKQSLITEAVTGKIKIQNGKACGKYEEYKDSGVEWIGEIPSGWTCVQIKNIFKFLGGYAFNSDDYVDETDYQILRIGNVKDFKLLFDSSPAYISKELASKVENVKLKSGYILFTMTGTRGKKDYFYTHEITESDCKIKNLYLNQRVGCLIPKSDIYPKYFDYLLKEKKIKDSVFLNETGTANQANIGSEDVMKIKLQLEK